MDTVNLVLSVPMVVALVELAKRTGLPTRWALLLAIALGIALSTASYYWATSGLFAAVMEGLLLGLAAAGLYDAAKTAAPTKLLNDKLAPALPASGEPQAAGEAASSPVDADPAATPNG